MFRFPASYRIINWYSLKAGMHVNCLLFMKKIWVHNISTTSEFNSSHATLRRFVCFVSTWELCLNFHLKDRNFIQKKIIQVCILKHSNYARNSHQENTWNEERTPWRLNLLKRQQKKRVVEKGFYVLNVVFKLFLHTVW